METIKLDSYLVVYPSGDGAPRIWLRAGNAYVGQVVFWPDGDPLPNDTPDQVDYHRREYPNVLDLLRNEGPVFLFSMDLDDGVFTALMTGVEAVGEGELHTLLT